MPSLDTAAAETPGLKLSARIVPARTGGRWAGEPVVELLDADGRVRTVHRDFGTLATSRRLYGRS